MTRVAVLDFACPTCAAPAGSLCAGASFHGPRERLAREANRAAAAARAADEARAAERPSNAGDRRRAIRARGRLGRSAAATDAQLRYLEILSRQVGAPAPVVRTAKGASAAIAQMKERITAARRSAPK